MTRSVARTSLFVALRFVLLAVLTIVCSFASAQESKGDQQLAERCNEFARVRLHYDMASAEELILPNATALFDDGKLNRNLLSRLKYLAEQKAKTEKNADKMWKPKPVRVLHREMQSHDSVATVTEFLGATATTTDGAKVKPTRRTTTWIKGGDTANQRWKVASLHESPYSTWEKSITAYEEKDKAARYAPGGIVFVGSSSIRGWKTLAEDFPGLPVLGRGFGGSQLIDSTMYAHRIVLPYRPSAVAVYAGDNDIAAGKSPPLVFHDFQLLVETLHAADPKIRIGFIAIKPSIKRWEMWPDMKHANKMIEEFAAKDDRITYLDIATPMLGENGEPKPELFVKDGLHLTPAGYELWTSVVMPWAKNN